VGREKVLVNHMWSNWMKGRSRAVSSLYISGVRTSTVCASVGSGNNKIASD
jgi:hypothetical protein